MSPMFSGFRSSCICGTGLRRHHGPFHVGQRHLGPLFLGWIDKNYLDHGHTSPLHRECPTLVGAFPCSCLRDVTLSTSLLRCIPFAYDCVISHTPRLTPRELDSLVSRGPGDGTSGFNRGKAIEFGENHFFTVIRPFSASYYRDAHLLLQLSNVSCDGWLVMGNRWEMSQKTCLIIEWQSQMINRPLSGVFWGLVRSTWSQLLQTLMIGGEVSLKATDIDPNSRLQ
jgi:hypothetical protein